MYVAVPRGNDGRLHTDITKTIFTDHELHKNMLQVYSALGLDFTPMKVARFQQARNLDEFQSWLSNIKVKPNSRQCHKQPRNVGEITGIQSLAAQHIRNLKQKHWDPQLCITKHFSISKLFDQFMTCLVNKVDPRNPPTDLPDLAACWHNIFCTWPTTTQTPCWIDSNRWTQLQL